MPPTSRDSSLGSLRGTLLASCHGVAVPGMHRRAAAKRVAPRECPPRLPGGDGAKCRGDRTNQATPYGTGDPWRPICRCGTLDASSAFLDATKTARLGPVVGGQHGLRGFRSARTLGHPCVFSKIRLIPPDPHCCDQTRPAAARVESPEVLDIVAVLPDTLLEDDHGRIGDGRPLRSCCVVNVSGRAGDWMIGSNMIGMPT